MTLLERIQARKCAVEDCDRVRHADSRYCRDDITEAWMNRLDYIDGKVIRRRTFTARDETGRLAA